MAISVKQFCSAMACGIEKNAFGGIGSAISGLQGAPQVAKPRPLGPPLPPGKSLPFSVHDTNAPINAGPHQLRQVSTTYMEPSTRVTFEASKKELGIPDGTQLLRTPHALRYAPAENNSIMRRYLSHMFRHAPNVSYGHKIPPAQRLPIPPQYQNEYDDYNSIKDSVDQRRKGNK